jgi:serine/threonine protein kinase
MREFTNYLLIVIEYAEGGSLMEHEKQRKSFNDPYSDEESALIMKNIFQGLSYLHKSDILH